jgi:hypothetical protein
MSYGDQLRNIANKFYASGQPSPATAKEIAAWAIRNGLWFAQPSDLIEQCAEEIARAMREEHISDAQGRSVRAKHVARIPGANGQMKFAWADIRNAPREFMAIAFQQRRQQIVGDCRQLKSDADSYNENKCPDRPIAIVFDFTRDLKEAEQQDDDAA